MAHGGSHEQQGVMPGPGLTFWHSY